MICTGYTHKLLKKGQSFQEFVLDCARAMFCEMRDAPSGQEIPEEFTVDHHYRDQYETTIEEIERLNKMTNTEKISFGQELMKKEIEHHKNTIEENNKANKTVSEMIDKVKQWTPPTDQHKEFKLFMLTQLSSAFQDNTYYERRLEKISKETAMSFYQNYLTNFMQNAEYYEKEYDKEVARNASNNAWIKSLRDSLK